MATFHPVNTTTLVAHPHARSSGDEANPLTPRPGTAPTSNLPIQPVMHRDDATTPTRANFKALGQKPLPPSSDFPATVTSPRATDEASPAALSRGDSTYSAKSGTSEDVDMDSDGADEGSDEESSLNADGTRSSKKKGKSQRFYCTDYPPCNLSFTRSEHLARHIRKHTGERPFQCHCSRRFSRLDNLRQHAQTVHQNEEIPPESLAATGTRFQRQVRSDRVRPPGSRSRANTAGSTGPLRGHTRNSLSTSSIGSSVGSAYSRDADMRRRPPPLVMAGEGHPFSREVREGSPQCQYRRPASPAGSNPPASATLPAGLNSPRWTSAMPSPISSHAHSHSHSHSHSRTASIYHGHRTPGRRLSVPSAGNPFQSPHGSNTYGPPALGRMHANMGGYSPSSSMMSSPTTSTSGWARRESLGSNADVEYRRRTWHPETMDNFPANYTSRLQQVTTNNYYSSGPPPRPPIVPSNAPPLQALRLPGIESFDPLPPRPSTPVRRHPSPMMMDAPTRAAPMHPEYRHERPNSQHWEQGMNRNMNQLRLQGTPPSDAANSWGSDVDRAVQAQGDQARATPVVRFEEYIPRPQTSGGPYHHHHQHHVGAPPAPLPPEKAKRFAWYHGPTKAMQVQPIQRTSPAESSGSESAIPVTPNSATHGEYNPGIVHASGRVETWNGTSQQGDPQGVPTGYYPPPQHSHEASYTYAPGAHQVQMAHQQQIPKSTDSNMLRLEALVAVATSEENVATAY